MTERILTTDDLWLPGDVLGGALLAGWAGPVVDAGHERVATAWPWPTVVVTEMHSPAPNMRHAQASGLRLDCNRPEVRDRIVRVLAAGEPCRGWSFDSCQHGTACPDCHGTGYLRPRHDLTDITTAELRGTISPTEAAALLWGSVQRVQAGLGTVRLPLPTWKAEGNSSNGPGTPTLPQWARRGSIVADVGFYYVGRHDCREGWALRSNVLHGDRLFASGPEVGDAGKAAADVAALSAGYALREPGALLLPLVDGVGRLDLP